MVLSRLIFLQKLMPFELCACLGPQGLDPVCPCQMRQQGLEPSNQWTEDDKQRLHQALDKIFFKKETE
jgi:hypothetical protein